MKNILVLIAVLGFVACSSKEKNENKEMVSQQTEASEDQASAEAKAAYEEAQKEAEAAAQKAAKEAQASNDSQDDESDSTGGDFGPYEGTEKSKTTCTSGDDVRTIAVLDGNDGGCGVVYNKMGNDKTIAVAQYDMAFCPEVQSKVKGNLESAGFTCE